MLLEIKLLNIYAHYQLNKKESIVIRIVADERKKASGQGLKEER